MKLPQTLHRIRPFIAQALAWSRRLFLPLALGFIAYSAYRASGSLGPLLANTSLPSLALACLCWTAAQWAGPLATTALTRAFGIPLGYRKLAMIAILRIPAKYLPGGIWQSVARFAAYREHAVKGRDSFAILLIEHVVALGTSIVLGSLLLLLAHSAAVNRSLAAGLVSIGLILLAMPLAWMLHDRSRHRQSFTAMLAVMAAGMLFWSLAGTAFLAYWAALLGLHLLEIPVVLSGYLLSWAAGFAAVFAPQGVGVFEWTAARLLPAALPPSVAVAAIAGFRIITICGDLLAWGLGLAIARNQAKPG